MQELPQPLPTFAGFVETCLAALVARNRDNQRQWSIERATRWQLDMDRRQLMFFMPDGRRVSAEPQIIGSLDSRRGRWLWAWDNTSIDAPLREHAGMLREYGRRWNLAPLTTASWPATEQDGWNMAALALHLFRAQGAYRAPGDGLMVFMTFANVKVLND